MKNDLFSIGPFTVHGYGLMIAIGVLAAYEMAEIRAKRRAMDVEILFSIAVWCLLGGAVGAKLLYYITELPQIIQNPRMLLNFGDGFVVYGGIIGGIASGVLLARVKRIDFWKYFDLCMPSVALAQGLGRIGCFLAGCCYGRETAGAFGIVFRNSDFAPNGVRLIPTQLISSGMNFIHCLLLLYVAKRVKKDGRVAGFYLVFYSLGRFIIEFYRGDLIRGSIGALSTSQFISIFTFLLGIAIVILRGRAGSSAGNSARSGENGGEPST